MTIIFEPTGTIENLRSALSTMPGARSVQILGAVGNDWTPELLDPVLTTMEVPVFGGLFPGVIYDGDRYDRGTVLIGHDAIASVAVVDCEHPDGNVERWLPALQSSKTVVTYVDATCPTGPLTDALFRELGAGPAWLGGGAGSLDFVRRPVILTPEGLRAGVAVLAGFDTSTRLGVTHGWQAFSEPMLVTEAEGNDIVSIDWRPAFEVYREVVESHSGRSFDRDGFYALASTYPLMLERFGAEGIVRDPLTALPGGRLRCAGDVQPNATIRVAHGEFSDMLGAAHSARETSSAGGVSTDSLALTIDCISRALLLGDRLKDELAALRLPGLPQLGALTIGEVASTGDRFLEVHNKTTVLAVIARGADG
jgi:hypothetical protein